MSSLRYGKTTSATVLIGSYSTEPSKVSDGMTGRVELIASMQMMTNPMISSTFRRPKVIPSSLSSHPSITTLTTFWASFPMRRRAR